MVRNLKQIIREELNDFEWAKDINYYTYDFLNNKALEFNPPITNKDHLLHVLGLLKDMGFNYNPDWVGWVDEIFGLFLSYGHIVYTDYYGEDNYTEHISNYVDRGVEVLDGWSLFPESKNINESEEFNDFEWTRDISTPWYAPGKKYKTSSGNIIIITDTDYYANYDVLSPDGKKEPIRNMVTKPQFKDMIDRGVWVPINENINESEEFNDFEWTKEIKPAKDQFPLEKETLYYFEPNIPMDRVRDTLIPKLKNTRGMKSSVIKSLTNISENPRYQREGIKFFYTDNLSKNFNGWCSSSEIEVYEWLDKVDGYEYFEIKPY